MKKLLILVTMIFVSSLTYAETAREIMQKVDDRDNGDTMISRVTLTTFRYVKKGKKMAPAEKPRVKMMDTVLKDYGPKGKDHKSVSIILKPQSEKGIGFLQYDWDDPNRETDQWLYLSAMGKIKRIVSGNDDEPKTGSFFGSELSYEDMESINIDEYKYKILGSEKYRKRDCWVIQSVPLPKRARKSNYSKTMIWVDKERFMDLKAILFNRNGKKVKKIYFKNIKKINGIFVVGKIVANNIETRRVTNMVYNNIRINSKVEDKFLTQRTLTDKGFRTRNLKKYQ
ncbi:MAG: outer membrane lipoprotein-sorting protein [Desulfobacterales bacterium]|nr:outer membrane lipoprotein-sorting protein [Desulfobacterales bacterium]MCP4161789.1 outer membrane lipoprotein-sorting protein [Deltaproteobacteria bacterium]